MKGGIDPTDVLAAFPEMKLQPQALGEGSFKVAFLANHRSQATVLKIIKDVVAAPDDTENEGLDGLLTERVRREIDAMRKVSNRHVVPIIAGPQLRKIAGDRHLWYEEPYYPGGTLDRQLGKAWPEDRAIKVIRGLLDGVEALWMQASLVHRDIKPPNIALDQDGEPVLLDLGIALHRRLESITRSQDPSPRTPNYAAPEQFLPRRHALIDFRTDLFLVGIVAYQILTAKHPFGSYDADPDAYRRRLDRGQFDRRQLSSAGCRPQLIKFLHRLLRPQVHMRFRTIQRTRRAFEESLA